MINDALVFDSTLHLADLSAEGLEDAISDKTEMDQTVELTNRLVGGLGNLDLVGYRRDDGTYSFPAKKSAGRSMPCMTGRSGMRRWTWRCWVTRRWSRRARSCAIRASTWGSWTG